MTKLTRGEFLKWVGLSGVLGADVIPRMEGQVRQAAGSPRADLVVVNAKVFTCDDTLPRAEAVAVKNGRFVAVGSSADIRNGAGPQTQIIDAGGISVVPGFIDCHNHAPGTTLLYGVLVGNPYEVEFVTIASIIDKLKAKARETPPGTWIDGTFSTTPR